MSSADFRNRIDHADSDRPSVAMPARPWVLPAAIVACVALGGLVFWQLSANRTRVEQQALTTPAADSRPILGTEALPPPQLAAAAAPAPAPAPAPVVIAPPAMIADGSRLKAPSLIVDLSESGPPASATGAPNAGVSPQALANAAGGGSARSADEQFAQRLGVTDNSVSARAQKLANPSHTVLQGAVIPAVLETAINSDLPGFARAIVSRDVRSFDGKTVLAPRGSRLVGQYRSGVALGHSRAFVIWTRLIRPDGVFIDLDSPASDALGRAGLEGEVDSHFLQRFGGAILLSLISAGVDLASNDRDTQVIINSSRTGADAASVALGKNLDIAPTITVPQGAAIRIFVARDLDFGNAAGSTTP
jgi:type IV secretion system protein VirB10